MNIFWNVNIVRIDASVIVLRFGSKFHSFHPHISIISKVQYRIHVYRCDWQGPQHTFAEHMKTKHRHNGAPFIYYQQSAVDFDSTKDISKINLINAFNKTFVFTYFAPRGSSSIFFFIFLLGRKSDAEKYLIDFELNDGLRKLKFIENCYNDVVDVWEIFAGHRCFVIPQKLAETYAKNGRLEFRFVIKKRDAVETDNLLKQAHMQNAFVNFRNMYGGGGPVPSMAMGRSVSMQNVANNYNNGPKRAVGGAQFPTNASHTNRQDRKYSNPSLKRR